ncbi:hypothetical protein RB594_001379 [Gaeumannomyces avenae]
MLPQLLLAAVAVPTCLAMATPVRNPELGARADTPSWHQYVRASDSRTIRPRAIVASRNAGNVSSPDGLITGKTPTVLSRLGPAEEKPSIVVDFGQNTVGILSIQFGGSSTVNGSSSARPGLKLAFSETLQFLTDRSDFTRSDHASGDQKFTQGTDQISVRQEPYEYVNNIGCQHDRKVCSDGLHGFRYVRIWLDALDSDAPYTTSTGTVSIVSMKLELSAFHGTPDTFRGNFECSDSAITQWWYDAVYTNDLCIDTFRLNDTEPRDGGSPTLAGKLVLHDGPKRDRDPYVGDLAVSALTAYLSHDVAESASNVLEDLALHQRSDGWIPPASIGNYGLQLFDYPLWWVVCSCDYVLYTGNGTFLQNLWPNLVKVLDGFYPGVTNAATGLIERKGYGDFAFVPREGAVTYYNALYVRALNYAADMAEQLGHSSDAPRWRSRATQVGDALLKRNWDRSVGAFYDGGRCGNQQLCPTHGQDGNSLAIMTDIANTTTPAVGGNGSIAESILSYLDHALRRPYGNAFFDTDDYGGGYSQRVYAFISYFEIEARFKVPSAADSAYDEIRRLYSAMASGDPGVTFWEGIGPGASPYEDGFTSMSHGWSTGIVPSTINHVLGIMPTKPGFAEWEVKPVIGGGLTWARGVAPTPNGEFAVSWTTTVEGGADAEFRVQISSPRGSKGTISVPVSGAGVTVKLNGQDIYNVGADGTREGATYKNGRVSFAVDGGKHDVAIFRKV